MTIIDIFRHCNNLDIQSSIEVYTGLSYDPKLIFKGELHKFISEYPTLARDNEVSSFAIYLDNYCEFYI